MGERTIRGRRISFLTFTFLVCLFLSVCSAQLTYEYIQNVNGSCVTIKEDICYGCTNSNGLLQYYLVSSNDRREVYIYSDPQCTFQISEMYITDNIIDYCPHSSFCEVAYEISAGLSLNLQSNEPIEILCLPEGNVEVEFTLNSVFAMGNLNATIIRSQNSKDYFYFEHFIQPSSYQTNFGIFNVGQTNFIGGVNFTVDFFNRSATKLPSNSHSIAFAYLKEIMLVEDDLKYGLFCPGDSNGIFVHTNENFDLNGLVVVGVGYNNNVYSSLMFYPPANEQSYGIITYKISEETGDGPCFPTFIDASVDVGAEVSVESYSKINKQKIIIYLFVVILVGGLFDNYLQLHKILEEDEINHENHEEQQEHHLQLDIPHELKENQQNPHNHNHNHNHNHVHHVHQHNQPQNKNIHKMNMNMTSMTSMNDTYDSMNMYYTQYVMDMPMGMQMTFYWGTDVTVMFEWWNTGGNLFYYLLTLIAVFLFAVAFEIFSALAVKYRNEELFSLRASLMSNGKIEIQKKIWLSFRTSILYTIRFIIAYALMLAVMTYNIGIAITIFVGIYIGKTFFTFLGYDSFVNDVGCH